MMFLHLYSGFVKQKLLSVVNYCNEKQNTVLLTVLNQQCIALIFVRTFWNSTAFRDLFHRSCTALLKIFNTTQNLWHIYTVPFNM